MASLSEFKLPLPETPTSGLSSSIEESQQIKVMSSTVVENAAVLNEQAPVEKSTASSPTSLCMNSLMESSAGKGTLVTSQGKQPSDCHVVSCELTDCSHESDRLVVLSSNSGDGKTESPIPQEKIGPLSAPEGDFDFEMSGVQSGLDVTVISPSKSPSTFKGSLSGQRRCQKSPMTVVVNPPVSPVAKRSLRSKRKHKLEEDEDSNDKSPKPSKRRKDSNASTTFVEPGSDYTRPHKKSRRVPVACSKQNKMAPVQLLPPVIHKKPICSLAKVKKGHQNLPNTSVQEDSVNASLSGVLPVENSPSSGKLHVALPLSVSPPSTCMDVVLTEVQGSDLRSGRGTTNSTEKSTPPSMVFPIVSETVTPGVLSYMKIQTETSVSSGGSISTLLLPTITAVTAPSSGQSPSSILSNANTMFLNAGNALVLSPIVSSDACGSRAIFRVDSTRGSFDGNSTASSVKTVTSSCPSICSSINSFPTTEVTKSACTNMPAPANCLLANAQPSTSCSLSSVGVAAVIRSLLSSTLASCSNNFAPLEVPGAASATCTTSTPPLFSPVSLGSIAANQSLTTTSAQLANPMQQCSLTKMAVPCLSPKDLPKAQSTSKMMGSQWSNPSIASRIVYASPVTQTIVHSAPDVLVSLKDQGKAQKVVTSSSPLLDLVNNSIRMSSSLLALEKLCCSQADSSSNTTIVNENVGINKEARGTKETVSDQEPEPQNRELHRNRFITNEKVNVTRNEVSESISLDRLATQSSGSCDQADAGGVEEVNQLCESFPREVPESTLPECQPVSHQSSLSLCTNTDINTSGNDNLVSSKAANNHVSKGQMDCGCNRASEQLPAELSSKPVAVLTLSSDNDVPANSETNSAPSTPTHLVYSLSSPKTTPAGILKHTSQFDSPSSASKVSCANHCHWTFMYCL